MISRLEAWDADVVVQNYNLRESLKNENNSKLNSAKVALACFKAEFAKSTFETASVASWLWNVIRLKGFGVSNLRELGLAVAEHRRNIAGICFSPFMSSQAAAETYLTSGPDQTPQSKKTEDEIAMLYAVTEGVVYVAKKVGSPFRATSGTALGLERCGSFIKGDDDVDLIFDNKDLPMMNFLFDQGIFEKMTGIKVFNQKKHTNGWQCYHERAEKPEGKNDVPAGYFVDVMPVREENGNYVFTHDQMRSRFLNDYVTKEEFNNVVQRPFGPISLNVPQKLRDYLVRAYREQGLKLSYKFVSHQTMGAALANPTSPTHVMAFVKGVFESQRRMAITEETSYNRDLYLRSKAEIFERIRAFQEELKVNPELAEKFKKNTIPFRVFVDGVYDLFHQGHARSFEKVVTIAESEAFGRKVELIVGVTGDAESASYKRVPVMTEVERDNAVRNHPLVTKVISRSPTAGPSKEFLLEEKIDLVLHGDDFNEEKCKLYYSHAMNLGIFKLFPYEPGVSTTDLIKSAKEKGLFPDTFINRTGIASEVLVDRIRQRNP